MGYFTRNEDTIDLFDHLLAINTQATGLAWVQGSDRSLRARPGIRHGFPGLLREATARHHHLGIIPASPPCLAVSSFEDDEEERLAKTPPIVDGARV